MEDAQSQRSRLTTCSAAPARCVMLLICPEAHIRAVQCIDNAYAYACPAVQQVGSDGGG